ncbi:phosphate ABC transporter substrate-binding protein, PhoT family [Oscillibacter sp. PC13]|uniref:phosphate ABC transporter substrate-binding protein n=1 Tax=Oscillibacter sp. PC13 TaxID=1855299 RepID=UPI0008DF67EE|nr:phosphate ABC transporter substrate-binding protein [Oscillibacter sp. PC13]SFO93921.1 phosphate ABC transporter substrate-binding protein, PhoT family [Oscillibacter sp. PC13]
MKKIFATLLALTMVMAMLAGCGSNNAAGDANADNSNNTQTQEPVETTLSGSVSTNGSTSMEKVIGVLSEQFMTDNSSVTVTYDATGSGTGIEAAKNGTCDIGLSSRALKDEEVAGGLVGTTVALDGIAVIVNADSKVADLTVEQIAQIFTGAVTDWSEVGGDASAISCVGREAGSGTRDGFESITGTKDACVLAQELTSTGAVIEAVKGNANAIGYASLSSVEGQDGIKALTVGGVACTEDTVLDGSYAIQRPFVLVTKDGAALSEQAQAFFDFATSTAANDLIKAAGAVPVAK